MSPPNLLVSVVVPAYNEIENLPELYRQLTGEFEKLDEALELLFVHDGSVDGTLDWLRAVLPTRSGVITQVPIGNL